ncbi:uncharacterized protein LOC127087351 [Lathyrus oleraceus]|uniref:uncharacterized protein LOC127087351 n=1 Tax=Pisum sativum TaxID=3888 RepID=UPI0021D12605|nr:uncharacterized protein LOC127087351 [Pisum sativum]
MFLRVTPITCAGRALKSNKLMLRFVSMFQIPRRVREMAYRVALLPYISNQSHVIQLDDVQVKENLTVENLPLRIEDREVKHLRGKEIAFVKVVWGGSTGDSVT